jgi:antitoxin component HigA of HigAB toxin-antitoxin module
MLDMLTKIITEDDYKATDNALQAIIKKGASLGGMDFLPDSDKMEFTRLGYMIKEWEDIYYPTPIIVSPLVKKIEERMSALNLKQRDTAKLLGISEGRMSELLSGKRRVSIRIAKRLRDSLNINSDFILDNL